MMMLPQAYLVFSNLQENHLFNIILKPNHFNKLTYQIDDQNTFVVTQNGNTLESFILHPHTIETIKSISGQIHHSVITSFVTAGVPHSLFYTLQNLFHDQLDLTTLPAKTTFKIVLDENQNLHHKKNISTQLIAAEINTLLKSYSIIRDLKEKDKIIFIKPMEKASKKVFFGLLCIMIIFLHLLIYIAFNLFFIFFATLWC